MGPSCGGRVGPRVELGVPLAQGLRIGGYHQGRGLVSGGQSSKTEKIRVIYSSLSPLHVLYQSLLVWYDLDLSFSPSLCDVP